MTKTLALAVLLVSFARPVRADDAAMVEFFGALGGLEAQAATMARSYPADPRVDMDWDQLDQHFVVRFPGIWFGNTMIGVNGVCIQGEYLRTRRRIKDCVQYVGRARTCVRYTEEYLVTPISRSEKECVRKLPGRGGQCVEWRLATYRQDLKPMVDVLPRRRLGKFLPPQEPLFQKQYEIPVCAD